MRRGSFNTDEFGQGIVDPDYSYNEDESRILCPGSLFLGPPTNDREWEWCVREWGPKRPSQSSRVPDSQRRIPSPVAHPGSRRWRLKPIPGSWDVAVDTEIEFVRSDPQFPYTGRSSQSEDIPVGVLQTITFKFGPILNPPPDWVQMYLDQIEDMSYSSEGMACSMFDIKFEFFSMQVWAEPDPTGEITPQYVDIVTHHPIHRYGWWNEVWEMMPDSDPCVCGAIGLHIDCPGPRGREADVVIIDETHIMTNERLRQHVEDAPTIAILREAAEEAPDEEERRQAILRRGEEAQARLPRPVAAQAQAGAHEEATGAADHRSQEATDQAGCPRCDQEAGR